MEASRRVRNQIMPPYAGYQTYLAVLQRVRHLGVPTNLYEPTIQGELSDSTYQQLMRTWRYLGLINAKGEPQPSLYSLVASEGEEFRRVLQEILKSSYQFLFGPDIEPLNLEEATIEELQRRFAEEGATGTTIRRGIYLLTQLARDAGMPLSDKLVGEQSDMYQDNNIAEIVVDGFRAATPLEELATRAEGAEQEKEETPHMNTVLPTAQPVQFSRRSIIEILLDRLPEFDRTWTSEERKSWLDSYNVLARIVEREKKPEV